MTKEEFKKEVEEIKEIKSKIQENKHIGYTPLKVK